MIADEIYALREEKQQVLLDTASRETAVQKVNDLIAFIEQKKGVAMRYDDIIVRKLIEKVIVFDDHFKVIFKAGMEVEVEA